MNHLLIQVLGKRRISPVGEGEDPSSEKPSGDGIGDKKTDGPVDGTAKVPLMILGILRPTTQVPQTTPLKHAM